jgi:hypothetical protein
MIGFGIVGIVGSDNYLLATLKRKQSENLLFIILKMLIANSAECTFVLVVLCRRRRRRQKVYADFRPFLRKVLTNNNNM